MFFKQVLGSVYKQVSGVLALDLGTSQYLLIESEVISTDAAVFLLMKIIISSSEIKTIKCIKTSKKRYLN